MSLTNFVTRPAIKEAFVRFATKERTPPRLRDAPMRVSSCGKLHGHAGTAFDYLARFHIARIVHGRMVIVHEARWGAEAGVARLPQAVVGKREARFWMDAVAGARVEAEAYVQGAGDVGRLAQAAQILANAEVLSRNMAAFDASFRPVPELTVELVAMLELLAAQKNFPPRQLCIMNPVFVASPRIQGGDADIVIDDRLIDFKTTIHPRVEQRDMLQIAGYAALQRMGGIKLDGALHTPPFKSVALYFARFGVWTEWEIGILFPGGGFDAFCRVFETEVQITERMAADIARDSR